MDEVREDEAPESVDAADAAAAAAAAAAAPPVTAAGPVSFLKRMSNAEIKQDAKKPSHKRIKTGMGFSSESLSKDRASKVKGARPASDPTGACGRARAIARGGTITARAHRLSRSQAT